MSKRSIIVLIALVLIVGAAIWVITRKSKDNDQTTAPLLSVFAYNQTKSAPATQSAASPEDVIVYTLTAENQTDKVVSGYIIEANIAEVTDKSTLIDASGASYNSATNSLVWTPLDISPKGVIQKQFSVRINALPQGSTSTVLRIKFNNDLEISIQPASAVQQVAGATSTGTTNSGATDPNINDGKGKGAYTAPVTGPAGDLILWLSSITTAVFVGVKRYRVLKGQ